MKEIYFEKKGIFYFARFFVGIAEEKIFFGCLINNPTSELKKLH